MNNNSPYPDFDKKKFRVRVFHYPNGYTHDCDKYTSQVMLFSVADRGTPIFSVFSKCNPGDIPRRKVGFRVAYEKAVKVAKALEII